VTDVVKLVVRANAWLPNEPSVLVSEMRDAIIAQAQEIKRLTAELKIALDPIDPQAGEPIEGRELSDAPPEDLVKAIAGQKAIIDGLVADRDRLAEIIGVFGIGDADDPVFYAKELVGLVEQYHAAKVLAETAVAEQAQEIERLMAIRPEVIKAEIATLEAKIIDSCAKVADRIDSVNGISAAILALKP
jgi:hypothetical protein